MSSYQKMSVTALSPGLALAFESGGFLLVVIVLNSKRVLHFSRLINSTSTWITVRINQTLVSSFWSTLAPSLT